MGLNTIHDYSEDLNVISRNITKDCDIRWAIQPNVNYTRLEKISGLPSTKFSCVIRSNGWANVSEGDRIKTPLSDKIYFVVRVIKIFY